MKKIYLLIVGVLISISSVRSQTVLVNSAAQGGFEVLTTFATNGWTSVNAAGTNQWFVGNVPTGFTGTRCAYISDNALGTTHNYANTASVSHFYRDIVIPASDNALTITFNWKCAGQNNNDDLQVFLVSTATTPVAGTSLGVGLLGTFRGNGSNPWQTGTITTCGVAGTMRLVFSWRNNADGTVNNVPIAIDNINVISSAISSNDLPCNAQPIALGVNTTGDNTCAGSASEPAAPGCWLNGTLNTVWYSFVAPASGSVRIKTVPVSSANPMQNTQIAVYSGTCGALTFISCNNDAPNCGTYEQYNSELTVAGLTPGATYFVVVDGSSGAGAPDPNTQFGQFNISVIDGATTFPLVPGQDCTQAFPLCNATTTIGNPGYQVIGGVCDHNGANNCTSGEANSVWYTINIGSAGNLIFDIVPNDYGNPNPITGISNPGWTGTNETDYDWVLWKLTGAGSTTCANITSSGGNNSIRCNFDADGVTGTSMSGNTPPAYVGVDNFDLAYETAPAVVAGEQYVLVIQNYSNSTSGFSLQFPGGSPVTFTPSPIVFWSGGGSSTNWNTAANWGGCNVPSCAGPAFDAVITSASAYQPVLNAGVYSVRDITINPGATLTINNGVTLQVCGNFVNNGSLVCLPGSTVTFVGTGTQNITGGFTGTNAFFHMSVNKPSGTVVLNNNIDVDGNFTTVNGTSILNSNGMYFRLGGHFANFNGNTTFTNTGATGTLEFRGTAVQNYNEGASQLDLNFVVMNHTGPGVTLLTNMFIKTATGSLTLTNGKINTGLFRVDVANSAPACVTTGNNNSYVNGNLYRTILPAGGTYDFPLGTSTLYERARLVISANTYTRLQTRFDTWPVGPNIQGGTECTATYSLQSEDMGYWTMTQTGGNTGSYNTTLFCNGATNTAGASGWTVEKATTVAGPWLLNGVCAASTATVVNRNNMSGFSVLAAAQSPTPLPVQLTVFDGYPEGKVNILNWITESETNNSHFIVERSSDGIYYSYMTRVEGAGNSNTVRNYTAVDKTPSATTYYRLKQVDFNGQSVDFGPIIISNNNVDDLSVQNLYPNPASGSFFIDVYSKNKLNANVVVLDSYGRQVYDKPITIDGLNTFEIQSTGWAPGVYVVKVMNEALEFQYISRIIIQ